MSGQFTELPVWETITGSWEKTSGVKGSFWAGLAILFGVMFVVGFMQSLTEQIAILSFLFAITGNIFGYFCQLGLVYMGINRAKEKPVDYTMMFYPFNLKIALMLIGLYVLQVLIFLIPVALGAAGGFLLGSGSIIGMIAGVLLCIAAVISILIIGVRLSLSMAFVLDAGASPVAALKSSFHATQGNFWNLVGIFLLQIIIIAVSVIPLGIGLIWTLPFGFICYGLIYQRLRSNA